jgi:hypothetical protein
MSRIQAKKRFTVDDPIQATAGGGVRPDNPGPRPLRTP